MIVRVRRISAPLGNFQEDWKNLGMLKDAWRFPRPEAAQHYADLLADAPRRPLAIFGPRQIGKTHFLTHDLQEAAQNRGWQVLYADLWGQADPLASINTALGALLRTRGPCSCSSPVRRRPS